MFRRSSASRLHSLPNHVDNARRRSFVSVRLSTLLIVLVAVAASERLTAVAEDVNAAGGVGPFSARSRDTAAGNVLRVGGYMAAVERQYRRFTRTRVDVMARKLGDDFNPELMSVAEPSLNRTRTTDVGVSSYNAQLRHVDLSLRDDVSGLILPLKPSVRKYIEKWMLQRASCRLRPAWTDLGALFWPRWVRQGSCGEDEDKDKNTDVLRVTSKSHRDNRRGRHRAPSCSWPPGMRCVPEASETVRLLHWHCGVRRRGRGGGRRPGVSQSSTKYHHRDSSAGGTAWKWRCKWKKVPYAVTTACFCSC